MSKPRPKIEVISAKPMSKVDVPRAPYQPPAPPRFPPTVIRPHPGAGEPSAANVLSSKDANANAVPTLPAKKGNPTMTACPVIADPVPAENTMNRKVPPPRPQAPPKAPARAKKLARQRQDGSQSPTSHEPQSMDECVSPSFEVDASELNGVDTLETTTTNECPLGSVKSGASGNSIPFEPPPVPPHCDDYDPDTYEYMEPIDSLYNPPTTPHFGEAGVATNWKAVSPSVGGPSGEGDGAIPTLKQNGVPPKPRRSFKEERKGGEEPTRPSRPPPPRSTSLKTPLLLPARPRPSVTDAALRQRVSTFVDSFKDVRPGIPTEPSFVSYIRDLVDDLHLYAPPEAATTATATTVTARKKSETTSKPSTDAPPHADDDQKDFTKTTATAAGSTALSANTSPPRPPPVSVKKTAKDDAMTEEENEEEGLIYDDVPKDGEEEKDDEGDWDGFSTSPSFAAAAASNSAVKKIDQSSTFALIPGRAAPVPPPGASPSDPTLRPRLAARVAPPPPVSVDVAPSAPSLTPTAPPETDLRVHEVVGREESPIAPSPPATAPPPVAVKPKPRVRTMDVPPTVRDDLTAMLKKRSSTGDSVTDGDCHAQDLAEGPTPLPLKCPEDVHRETNVPSWNPSPNPPGTKPKPALKPKPAVKPKPAARLSKAPITPSSNTAIEPSSNIESDVASAQRFRSDRDEVTTDKPSTTAPLNTVDRVQRPIPSSSGVQPAPSNVHPPSSSLASAPTSVEAAPSNVEAEPTYESLPELTQTVGDDYQPLIPPDGDNDVVGARTSVDTADSDVSAPQTPSSPTRAPILSLAQLSLELSHEENIYESIKSEEGFSPVSSIDAAPSVEEREEEREEDGEGEEDVETPTAAATTTRTAVFSGVGASAVVAYDFEGEAPDELAASVGERLVVYGQVEEEWLQACVEDDPERSGIIPKSFVQFDEDSGGGGVVESGEERRRVVATARCTFEFTAEMDDELQLDKDDLVEIFDYVDEEWARGAKTNESKVGIFPLAFVTALEEVGTNPSIETTPGLEAESSRLSAVEKRAAVIHEFVAEADGDLEMRLGDQIVVLETIDSDWGFGRNLSSGKKGIFPWNFVDVGC